MCCFNKLKCRRNAAQKSLAEFAARRLRIRFDPFFAAAPPKGTSVGRVRREKYFALASAQRNWPRQTRRLMSGQSAFSRILCVKTRGSERKLFCQKRATPFFDKLKSLDRAGQGIFQLLQALLAYRYLRMPSVATEASAVRVTVNFTVLASLNLSSQHRNFSTAVKSSLCTILQRLST